MFGPARNVSGAHRRPIMCPPPTGAVGLARSPEQFGPMLRSEPWSNLGMYVLHGVVRMWRPGCIEPTVSHAACCCNRAQRSASALRRSVGVCVASPAPLPRPLVSISAVVYGGGAWQGAPCALPLGPVGLASAWLCGPMGPQSHSAPVCGCDGRSLSLPHRCGSSCRWRCPSAQQEMCRRHASFGVPCATHSLTRSLLPVAVFVAIYLLCVCALCFCAEPACRRATVWASRIARAFVV